MNRKFRHLSFGAFILFCATVDSFADQTVKQRMTAQGQTVETTVMIKGARQRSEGSMGGEAGKFMPKVTTVTQCDLRRTLQMNDAKRLYFIQSMVEEVPENAPASGANSGARASAGGAERGGVVMMSYTITDTGERKQMFGMTARHIKTVMTVEPSPGACQKDKMRMETDGWYVDLPGFDCPLDRPQVPQLAAQANNAGCQDRTRYKTSGSEAKLGFPLNVTMTIFDQSGKPQTTMTTETLELSNATLDAALFDVPKGYTQASSAQDLYKFDPAEMMRQMGNEDPDDGDDDEPPTNHSNPSKMSAVNIEKTAGAVRIGILAPSNKSGQKISTGTLRSSLIDHLSSGSVEAVTVDSIEDARAKSCDFVLSTDITKLKQSSASKAGGIFGKVTGVEAGKEKFEAEIGFRLISVANGEVTLQNKVTQKAEGDAETVTLAALDQVATAVSKGVKGGN